MKAARRRLIRLGLPSGCPLFFRWLRVLQMSRKRRLPARHHVPANDGHLDNPGLPEYEEEMQSIAKPARVLCWLLVALATMTAAAASQAASPGAALGLIVKLRNAPANESSRESAQARGRGNFATDQPRWQRVLDGSHVGPRRMRPVGRASQLLEFGRPLPAAEAHEIAEALRRQPDVEWVVPNEREQRLQVVPNDPYYPATAPGTGQWWLRRVSGSDNNVLADRLRGVPGFEAAWSTGIPGSLGDPTAIVAVLDTGITSGAYEHPELAGKVIAGYDFVSEVEYANDGDGRDADPSDPGDWVDHDDLTNSAFDGCVLEASSWHGTLIAGQIAALTNEHPPQGVAGIGWNTKVLAVRVAGKCGATVSDIVDGIRWAAGLPVVGVPIINPNPARIINISFGGDAACNAEYQAAIDEVWNRKGAIVVAAAGNEHAGLSRPASCDKVVGVVGLNRDGFKNNYSNFDATASAKAVIATVGGDDDGADSGLWAPYLADDGILTVDNCGSTVPRIPSTCPNGPYAFLFGTSFSAPIVSGAAALMLAVNKDLTAQQLVDGLRLSARPHVTSPLIGNCSWDNPGRCICTTSTCGAGILDAEQALRYAEAVRTGQPYTNPNRPVVLDNPEIRAAVQVSPKDRDPNPPVTDGSTSKGGGGGGAMGIGWLILLALATVELARLRQRQVGKARQR
jgi:serine protease